MMDDKKREVINSAYSLNKDYIERYVKYAFDLTNENPYKEQLDAIILRYIHTVEKGLSVENYQSGRGKNNILKLIESLEKYVSRYGHEDETYLSGLCACKKYFEQNRAEDVISELYDRYRNLPGTPNDTIGIEYRSSDLKSKEFSDVVCKRKSVRHFGNNSVDMQSLTEAINLAQNTPSACNRQGWITRIIASKDTIVDVLKNQNGNKGFSDEIDKLILITYDLKTTNIDRELHQAFIDGGMYAMTLIYSLEYHHLACVPLSASLNEEQYENVRKILNINDSEVFILFLGVGEFPEEYKVAKSHRKNPNIIVY